MIQSMQPIIKHLFQTDSLEDISRERLEAFVEDYPSFGIGHYLLSRKLRAEDDNGHFAEATRRTNLYFTNPFWLQWQLENAGTAARTGPRPTPPPYAEEPVSIPEEPVSILEEQASNSEEPVSIPVMDLVAEPEPAELEVADQEEPIRDEEPPFILEETIEIPHTTQSEPATEEPAGQPAADSLLQSIREAHELRESLQRINEDPGTETLAASSEEEESEPESMESENAGSETGFPGSAVGASLEKAAKESGFGVSAAGGNTAPPPQEDSPIAFEPYHTIDYFASQGIKLTQAQVENPGDTLGRQLKSFTDWLKVMRRLPQKDREMVPDIAAERNIQTIAAHSIEGKEVVTEAMAEVLAKQGIPEKAREVYEKLSLLNPGKRAYFAAKIEQLNIH